jgi:hypothetical protein
MTSFFALTVCASPDTMNSTPVATSSLPSVFEVILVTGALTTTVRFGRSSTGSRYALEDDERVCVTGSIVERSKLRPVRAPDCCVRARPVARSDQIKSVVGFARLVRSVLQGRPAVRSAMSQKDGRDARVRTPSLCRGSRASLQSRCRSRDAVPETKRRPGRPCRARSDRTSSPRS